ncbi:MAG: hypothetical protein ABIO45_06405 [Burkholderiaceae bacterium]
MLVFTNRATIPAADETAFATTFEPGGTRLALAGAARVSGRWQLAGLNGDVGDDDAMQTLVPLFRGRRAVLVYLHGNNNSPAQCFERCHALAALYDLEVIGFSWASEGFLSDGGELPGLAAGASGDELDLKGVKAANRTDPGFQRRIRRYHQARINAQDSVDALARFLRMLGAARLYANTQPFTVAAHSLGAHFLQYALEVPGAGESLGTAHNVALLAACARAAGHRDWLGKIQPKGQVFVTFNKGDSVLLGAFIADGQQTKLGTDPGAELLKSSSVRYVSFTNAKVGFGGHGYFVNENMPKKMLKVFARIFGSSLDIAADEYPRQVYPVGCDANELTCYMAAPDPVGLP